MTGEEELYGRTPVGRMFLRCAVPGMVSGLVWAVCAIADGIVVGNFLGSGALAAVSLAMPVLTVMMAVSDLVAAGSSIRISILLGAADADGARRVFTGSVKLIVVISIAFMLAGTLLARPMVGAMGAEGELADTAALYIAVFSALAPAALLFYATDNYLRICGAVGLSMWINVAVTVLNVVLVVALIGWLGLGAWASALALALSSCAGTLMSLTPFLRGQLALRFTGGWLRPREVAGVAYNGMSTFFNTVSSSLFAILANSVILAMAGDAGVSSYGIVMYVDSVIFSLFTGMSAAMQPAISYNHGAGDGGRVRRTVAAMAGASLAMSLALTAVCVLAEDAIVSVFLGDGDGAVAAMAATGLGIFALSYLFKWAYVCSNQVLAATDLPAHAMVVGLMSQLFLPAILLLAMRPMGLEGAWWSMVLAAAVSAVFAVAMLWAGSRRGIFRGRSPAAA